MCTDGTVYVQVVMSHGQNMTELQNRTRFGRHMIGPLSLKRCTQESTLVYDEVLCKTDDKWEFNDGKPNMFRNTNKKSYC